MWRKRNRVEQWQPETDIWQHGIGRQIIRIEDISAVQSSRNRGKCRAADSGMLGCVSLATRFNFQTLIYFEEIFL